MNFKKMLINIHRLLISKGQESIAFHWTQLFFFFFFFALLPVVYYLRSFKMAQRQWKPEVTRICRSGHPLNDCFCFVSFLPISKSFTNFPHSLCSYLFYFHQLELCFYIFLPKTNITKCKMCIPSHWHHCYLLLPMSIVECIST